MHARAHRHVQLLSPGTMLIDACAAVSKLFVPLLPAEWEGNARQVSYPEPPRRILSSLSLPHRLPSSLPLCLRSRAPFTRCPRLPFWSLLLISLSYAYMSLCLLVPTSHILLFLPLVVLNCGRRGDCVRLCSAYCCCVIPPRFLLFFPRLCDRLCSHTHGQCSSL